MKLNKKAIYKFLGIVFMVVGIIGIFLPVFPTTPFVLLAAFLFFNSSPRLFMILINNRLVGLPLYIFLRFRSIELRSKLIGLLFLWSSGTVSMQFIDNFYVKLVMFLVFLGVTIHIASFKNMTREEKEQATRDYRERFQKCSRNDKTRTKKSQE